MEEKKEKEFQDIIEEAKTYVDTRLQYTRLFVVKSASKLFADLITTAIVAICFTLAFIIGTITLAFYLASVLGSNTAGFGSVALIYLALAVVVYFTKEKYIEKTIVNFTIRKYFEKQQENEQDEQSI